MGELIGYKMYAFYVLINTFSFAIFLIINTVYMKARINITPIAFK